MKFQARKRIERTATHGALAVLRCYQVTLSPLLGPACRFYPTCSEYAKTAIERYGMVKGVGLAVKRVFRCHPFHPGGYDPIP